METSINAALLVFTLDGRRYALSLQNAERVILAVAVTPLSQAPAMVLGVINVQGHVVPVISGRKWFGLLERPVQLSDRLIIMQLAERKVALLVDSVIGVVARDRADEVRSRDLLPGLGSLASVVKDEEGLILLHHLDDLGLLAKQIEQYQFNLVGMEQT